jgi:3-deoxy-manno-octulosonate cytidylyltransferase (CMP-KDO synthetase)
MKVLAVIPARYASSRFPGKPLAMLGGESIISRVYHRVCRSEAVEDVVVATDSEDICDHVESFCEEGAVMMTSDQHRSGTDRCGEVVQRLDRQGYSYDIVLNVQGDEPFVDPAQLQALVDCFSNPEVQIATLVTRITSTNELLSPNNVKVVCSTDGRALYFSRQAIPFRRDIAPEQWLDEGLYFKHVGIYAFRSEVLPTLCKLEPGHLEEAEKLEQLRWMEAGFPIHVALTEHANIGIDTPDDLAVAEKYLKQQSKR